VEGFTTFRTAAKAALFAGANLVGINGKERNFSMIDVGYPYGGPFQRKLLAVLVQHPKETSSIIQPDYFEIPTLVDIARVVIECHKKHPDATLSYVVLKEALRASLSRKTLEHWSHYKEDLRAAFQPLANDTSVLLELATKFSRRSEFRDALLRAENCVNAGAYEKIPELFQKALERSDVGAATTAHWRDLPHPSEYPCKPVEWLIEGLIPENSISVLSGNEGVGKTIFLLSMARSLTEGMDFVGRPTYLTPVIYLGTDVSKAILQRYLAMMRWAPDDEFRILTMWTNPEAPMLDDKERMKTLFKYAEKYRPVMIFDTLRDFYNGDENSSTDTKPVVDVLRRLCSLGSSIVAVAHPPKHGNSLIRGSGNIPQKADIPYFMEAKKLNGKDVTVITCPNKNRFGTTSFALTFQKQFIPIPGALPYLRIREMKESTPSVERKQNGVRERVFAYIKENPGKNQQEIESALKMSDKTVRQILVDGETSGALRHEKGERKEKCWYFEDSESHQSPQNVGSVLAEVSRELAKSSSKAPKPL
jgi:archaellum biogenesis ATPase FlaH